MLKIFKYQFDENGVATIPEDAWVIRKDHVDDGFYLGDFVWANVDTEKLEPTQTVKFDLDSTGKLYSVDGLKNALKAALTIRSKNRECDMTLEQVGVTEKQILEGIVPCYITEDDKGKLWVGGEVGDEDTKYELAFFKTGQEIDVDIKDYIYIGLGRLWIIQELGLYAFVKEVK